MEVRKIIGRDVPPSYINFSGIIIIQKYASKMKLRRLISGKGSYIAFLLAQVKPRLINYTTTVRILLSIMETLNNNYVPLYWGIVSQKRTTNHI